MNCLPKNVGVDEAEGEEKKTLNKLILNDA
jgi:hypothetical protein